MNGPKTRGECWRQVWVPIGRQFTCLTISQDMLSHCYRSSERCRSGRTGRSRKPLSLLRGTEGSNPSLSAIPSFLTVSWCLRKPETTRLSWISCLPSYPAVSYYLKVDGGKDRGTGSGVAPFRS